MSDTLPHRCLLCSVLFCCVCSRSHRFTCAQWQAIGARATVLPPTIQTSEIIQAEGSHLIWPAQQCMGKSNSRKRSDGGGPFSVQLEPPIGFGAAALSLPAYPFQSIGEKMLDPFMAINCPTIKFIALFWATMLRKQTNFQTKQKINCPCIWLYYTEVEHPTRATTQPASSITVSQFWPDYHGLVHQTWLVALICPFKSLWSVYLLMHSTVLDSALS